MIWIIFPIYLIFIFLFIILFSYLHELGRQRELDKVGIPSKIKFHILDNIKKTFKEVHPFATISFDEKKFNRLNKIKKTKILLAGIKIDLIIITILMIVILIFYFLLFLEKNINLFYMGFFSILLLITQIIKFYYNLFTENSDIGKLKKLVNNQRI